jgi:hypothetical protein
MSGIGRTALITVAALVCATTAWTERAAADAKETPAAPAKADIALFRVEPLGLDDQRAARLEALFRAELERLAGAPLPARATVERTAASDAQLRGCTAETECLIALGKKLGVKQVVSGNVGELGDSYILNLKLVDVTTGTEVRKISEPLRGSSPDELIEATRVAAYRLLKPEALKGSVTILSDVAGASVFLDGQPRGKTPLAKPIAGLPIGPHQLRLTAAGYTDFISDVEVRFQKSTQVVVSLVVAKDPGGKPIGPARPAETPWYSSTWGYVGIGVGAVLLGVLIGSALGGQDIVDCDEDPAACGR